MLCSITLLSSTHETFVHYFRKQNWSTSAFYSPNCIFFSICIKCVFYVTF
jgi:hypothetical protein